MGRSLATEDNVFLGPNAVVVGGVLIGHDSIIAGNAFVNFDAPKNSIVIGSPGVIHKKCIRREDHANK